jgi:hypothetical protein
MAYTNLYNEAVSQGTNYKTANLLQDIDSNFGEAFNTTDETYSGTFTNSNLSSGVLTVTHNLNTGFPKPVIRRPDGTYEEPISIMTHVSDNQVTFDFGGSIATGTWYIQIRS